MLKIWIAIVLVFISCGANVFFLEYLIKFSPKCGDLVTFTQFLVTASYGFVTVSECGKKKPVVPIKEYIVAVLLYYGSSLTGNLAFSCNISMPIQMIFKSGSVMASMALGVLLMGKRYPLSKYISVAMITIGIAACLLISAGEKDFSENTKGDGMQFFFGILLLTVSLLTGARLGIAQEQISLKHGKNPQEMLFYIHALSLPFFVFFSKNIYNQALKFSNSEMYSHDYLPFDIPIVWLYLAMNICTQFICVNSVTLLTTEISALAVTVVLTVRKFMSLIISIIYFQNPFTMYHWMGTLLVFCGTLIFSEVPQKIWKYLDETPSKEGDQDKKKNE